jgi:hypothetical protein
MIFDHRASLNAPIRNAHGNIIVRALPELLLRPYAGESAAALEQRRADWMQRVLSVWVAGIACTDFGSKLLRNPEFEKPGADPLLSMHRWALEAGLPEDEYKDPVNGIERAVRFLGHIGFISKTIQCRAKKPDGSIRSYGAARRRVAFKWLYSIGGEVERVARETHAERVRKAENERLAQKEKDDAFTAAAAQLYPDPADADDDAKTIPQFAAPVAEPPPPDPDALLFAIVEREHPDWIERNDIRQINAELRRLRRLTPPNTS